MRWLGILVGALALALAGCGGGTKLLVGSPSAARTVTVTVPAGASASSGQLGIPTVATKNTTRIDGSDPIADAAGVALAVYPSAAPGTHPSAVVLAPTDDWQAALAASVLMSSPVKAPLLLSGPSALPAVSSATLKQLAPTGSGQADGAQLIRVGDVPSVPGLRAASISGANPYALAAGIDRFESAIAGRPASDVVIASAAQPAYAMPAAGWAAESGDPILFVSGSGIPLATRQALQSHQRPHIYVLGPPSVISDGILSRLEAYGTVRRVGAADPAANSVAFAAYRDPACAYAQQCVHVPGSFGWAIRSPGHGYVLLNAARPLDAAAAAPLSASGSFGPELVLDGATSLPRAVLDYFLDYATPGYTQEGPTAAVYNHGWVIGDAGAVSLAVQAEVDSLLEAVPQAGGAGQ